MFDYNSFFNAEEETQELIERTTVKDGDIDGVDYVEGSQGQVKKVEISQEDRISKRGGSIAIEKIVYEFKYGDIDSPTNPTSIEKKLVDEEV